MFVSSSPHLAAVLTGWQLCWLTAGLLCHLCVFSCLHCDMGQAAIVKGQFSQAGENSLLYWQRVWLIGPQGEKLLLWQSR